MKVGLHVFKQQVHIFVVVGPYGFVQLDYVRMLELFKDFDLSVSALGISRMLKGIEDLLEGKNPFGRFLLDLPDMSVGSRTYFFEDGKPLQEMALDIS